MAKAGHHLAEIYNLGREGARLIFPSGLRVRQADDVKTHVLSFLDPDDFYFSISAVAADDAGAGVSSRSSGTYKQRQSRAD